MICRAMRGGEIVGAAPRSFHRVLRADPLSVRRTLTDLRRRLGTDCSGDELGRLELVLAEVLNNIVEHGAAVEQAGVEQAGLGRAPEAVPAEGATRARAVHLLVSMEARGFRCTISDRGVLLPDECLAPRSLPRCEPDLPEGGFGWCLIQGLAEDLTYSRQGGRNCLAFTLPVEEAAVVAA